MHVRDKIIEQLHRIEDELLLQKLLELVLGVSSGLQEERIPLSEAQKEAVRKGLEDVQAGRTYSHEQVAEMTAKWLKEQ